MRHLYLNLCSSQGLLIRLLLLLPLSPLYVLSIVENMQHTALPVHYILTVKVILTICLTSYVVLAKASTNDTSTRFKYFIGSSIHKVDQCVHPRHQGRPVGGVEASPNRLVAINTMKICHVYSTPRLEMASSNVRGLQPIFFGSHSCGKHI